MASATILYGTRSIGWKRRGCRNVLKNIYIDPAAINLPAIINDKLHRVHKATYVFSVWGRLHSIGCLNPNLKQSKKEDFGLICCTLGVGSISCLVKHAVRNMLLVVPRPARKIQSSHSYHAVVDWDIDILASNTKSPYNCMTDLLYDSVVLTCFFISVQV